MSPPDDDDDDVFMDSTPPSEVGTDFEDFYDDPDEPMGGEDTQCNVSVVLLPRSPTVQTSAKTSLVLPTSNDPPVPSMSHQATSLGVSGATQSLL